MQIFFQTKKIELQIHEKEFMLRRMEGLKKFFSAQVSVYIDVERTHMSNHGNDLYYVSIRVEDVPYKYFAEEYKDDIRKSFDHAYGDLYRIIRKDRSKSKAVFRSARRTFKRIFRKKAR